jgi:hypothetical protein
MIPFIACTLPILFRNWFVAREISIVDYFFSSQVSSRNLRGRHPLLFRGNDIRRCWHHWSFQQNDATLFHSSNRQLSPVRTAAVQVYTMSATSTAKVIAGVITCADAFPSFHAYRLDPDSNKLNPSEVEFKKKDLKPLGWLMLRFFSLTRFIRYREYTNNDNEVMISTTNFTIINTVLCWCGPLPEQNLSSILMLIQVCMLAGTRLSSSTVSSRLSSVVV